VRKKENKTQKLRLQDFTGRRHLEFLCCRLGTLPLCQGTSLRGNGDVCRHLIKKRTEKLNRVWWTCFYLWFDDLIVFNCDFMTYFCLSFLMACDLMTWFCLSFDMFLFVVWWIVFTCDFMTSDCVYLCFDDLLLLVIWLFVFACYLTSCFHLWLDELFYLSFENMFLLVILGFVFTYLITCFCLWFVDLWFDCFFLFVISQCVFTCCLNTCFCFWFDDLFLLLIWCQICFNTVWTLPLHEVSRIEWKSQYVWIQSMLLRYLTNGKTSTHSLFVNDILFLILNRNKGLCFTLMYPRYSSRWISCWRPLCYLHLSGGGKGVDFSCLSITALFVFF